MPHRQKPDTHPPAPAASTPLVQPDAWTHLRQLTPARIALGRAGGSLPTGELLDFQLSHAHARDAVHAVFRADELADQIRTLGLTCIRLVSAATDRDEFLKRPDLGRRLDEPSRAKLTGLEGKSSTGFDLALIVSDGLSALAVERQVVPLISEWLPLIHADDWRLAPVAVVEHGRVAIEDEIGQLLAARVAVILIGERPGLGSPDSLGTYLVYDPRPGLTDAERNCVSNIRPEGLQPRAAALKLHYLVREALARRTSGISLKDESLAIETQRDMGGREDEFPSLPGRG